MLIEFRKHTPRWIIFLIDIAISTFSLLLAYLLRFNFKIPLDTVMGLYLVFPIAIGIRGLGFLIAKTYAGLVRYTGIRDGIRIFISLGLGSILFIFINLFAYKFNDHHFFIPFSIVVLEFLCSGFLLIFSRILIKLLYEESVNPHKGRENAVIFGAGESGLIAKRTIDRDAGTKYRVIAFFDDDKDKSSNKMEGVEIIASKKLDLFLQSRNVTLLIIAVQKLEKKRINEITEICLKNNVKVRHIPPVYDWINGELSYKQIKHIQIEELLGRESIVLNNQKIKNQLKDRTILVTGAAGSIGSEICRQVARYHPKKLILLDQAESSLYELEYELSLLANRLSFDIFIADITNKDRLKKLFDTYHPEIIYHAAAYKHVPLMELNAVEAAETNIIGTKNLVDFADAYEVEKFIMISTDKAVNPTNVMGASKRIAEIYVQALNKNSQTIYITTRFGNVLGSNGSVISVFKKQIESGGPITVTHPEITRYFMTIPEACSLVLEAGSFGEGGEIFVFDMGDSVKIINLAKKMIKLSGLTIGKDIQITFTGLRPGEKIYEELLSNKETALATHHPKIMIAKVETHGLASIQSSLNKLHELIKQQDDREVVRLMKSILPRYKSQQSKFEELDH